MFIEIIEPPNKNASDILPQYFFDFAEIAKFLVVHLPAAQLHLKTS
jgi:hypothetical protein